MDKSMNDTVEQYQNNILLIIHITALLYWMY